jgi:hypothetical protein
LDVIEGGKVMPGALKELEGSYLGTASSLVSLFFPGPRDEEERWWSKARIKRHGRLKSP